MRESHRTSLAFLLIQLGLLAAAQGAEPLQGKPPPASPAKPPILAPAPPKAGPAMPPALGPRQVMTGEISMTGRRLPPVALATGEIAMTGLRLPPAVVDTQEITMTGRR